MAENIGTLAVTLTATDKSGAALRSYQRGLDGAIATTGRLSDAFGRLGHARTALDRALNSSALARLQSGLGNIHSQAAGLGRSLLHTALPMVGAGSAVAAGSMAVTSFLNTASQLRRGARELGMSAQDLQAFQNGARQLAGVDAERATEALQSLDTAMFDAIGGRNAGFGALANSQALGFAWRDSANRALPLLEVLRNMSAGYSRLSPQAQRLVRETAGLSDALHDVLRQGPDVITEMYRQGRAMGTFTDGQIEAGARLRRQWDRTRHTGERLGLTIGAGIVPGLERLTTRVDALVQRNEGRISGAAGGFMSGLEEQLDNFDQMISRAQRWLDTPLARWWFDMDDNPQPEGGFGSNFFGQGRGARRNELRTQAAGDYPGIGLGLAGGLTTLGRSVDQLRESMDRSRQFAIMGGRLDPRTGFPTGIQQRRNQDLPRNFGSFGGQAGPSSIPGNQRELAQASYDRWRARGYSHEEAVGIVANMIRESGLNVDAENQTGHAGLFQHDRARRQGFVDWSARNGRSRSTIRGAPADMQEDYAHWEMQGPERTARAMLRRGASEGGAAGAARAFSRGFERPGLNEAERAAEAERRASIAAGLDRVLRRSAEAAPPPRPAAAPSPDDGRSAPWQPAPAHWGRGGVYMGNPENMPKPASPAPLPAGATGPQAMSGSVRVQIAVTQDGRVRSAQATGSGIAEVDAPRVERSMDWGAAG
ncbi:phage tail tip lysozyme [Muricoccus radiodurans]|uniref:phage tail tip lysozyme n=1 Tax=Muricoccus radiodurans TaxID=2231721 RepID=UPI003CED61FB